MPDYLPLVEYRQGLVTPFQSDWLHGALLQAAGKAGYQNWWLAGHVTDSVTTYLQLQFGDPVVGMPRLTVAVQSVLQAIGYAEVACHFSPPPPPLGISLLELAHRAGTGYELAFFGLLRHTLQQHLDGGPVSLRLYDLQSCVKELRAAKNWRRDCIGLNGEIVAAIREQIAAAAQEAEVTIIS